MFRPAFRIASASSFTRTASRTRVARRFASTAPPHQKSRSWKSSAARWGLAGAIVYYYNTATAFAEEPAHVIHVPAETAREAETYQTVASVSDQRRAQSRLPSQNQMTEVQHATSTAPDAEQVAPGSPEALEEEASEQGAFNEETGEINWDCPCLGGMAHGPCGEQFRAAFSCFVFSKEEPKGVDCIEHFKTMQDCFRQHPDVYGAELDDEDDEPVQEGQQGQSVPESREANPVTQVAKEPSNPSQTSAQPIESPQAAASEQSESPRISSEQTAQGRSAARDTAEDDMPQAWHDARSTKQSP